MEENQKFIPFNQRLCRYFYKSRCFNGNRCLFSHDRNISERDNVCRYFMKGRCFYGSSCKFEHIRNNVVEIVHSVSSNFDEDQSFNNEVSTALPSHKESTMILDTKKATEDSVESINSEINVANLTEDPTEEGNLDQQESKQDDKKDTDNTNENKVSEESNLNTLEHDKQIDVNSINAVASFSGHSDALESEEQMSAAIKRSAGKICSVCFETVMEKKQFSQRRFGILENCNHIFCVTCIRKWRQVQSLHSVARKCPECRVFSHFFVPNLYWVDNSKEKEALLNKYKEQLSKTPCRFFKQGQGSCRNRGSCLYLHTYPDGTKAILPPRGESNETISVADSDELEMFTYNDLDEILIEEVENVMGVNIYNLSNLVYVLLRNDDDDESNIGGDDMESNVGGDDEENYAGDDNDQNNAEDDNEDELEYTIIEEIEYESDEANIDNSRKDDNRQEEKEDNPQEVKDDNHQEEKDDKDKSTAPSAE